jgi:hypothetical protein
VLVAAGLAGMDADVRAALAEGCGPIAVSEMDVLLSWDVELRALFHEAERFPEPVPSLPEWLGGLPGYPDFARTALEAARARVAAIHAGEIPYKAEKAFDDGEKRALGRAVRLALHRDEPWLPELLDELVRGIAVAPTQAKTLPSQALLFEIARAAEECPTPEAISALRTARRITRHGGVPMQLDRKFKRMEPALAERLEVAFRIPDGRVRQAIGEHRRPLHPHRPLPGGTGRPAHLQDPPGVGEHPDGAQRRLPVHRLRPRPAPRAVPALRGGRPVGAHPQQGVPAGERHRHHRSLHHPPAPDSGSGGGRKALRVR